MDLLGLDWPKSSITQRNFQNRKGLGGFEISDLATEKHTFIPVENWKAAQNRFEEIDKIYGPNSSEKEKKEVIITTPKEQVDQNIVDKPKNLKRNLNEKDTNTKNPKKLKTIFDN